MRLRGLFWWIFAAFSILLLAGVGLLTWAAATAIERLALEQSTAHLTAQARLLEPGIPAARRAPSAPVDAVCPRFSDPDQLRLTVLSPTGEVLCRTSIVPAGAANLAGRPEIEAAMAGRMGTDLRYHNAVEADLLYVAVPLMEAGRVAAIVRLATAMPGAGEALEGLLGRAVLIGALLLAGAGFVAYRIARWRRRPLDAMRRAAERFAQGDLSGRVPVPRTPDLRGLAESLNAMAGQLDERLREVLAERNEQEAVLASMMEGVLAVDLNSQVIDLNRAAAELFNADPGQARGRNLLEVVRNPDLQRFVADTLASSKPTEREIVLHNRRERVLNGRGTVLRNAEGRRIGALVVLNDVTDLRRLENLRREFVANVSHELKTPITSIQGFVETLLDGALEQPETAQRFLRIIARQTERLSAIIEDLLLLSRVEREAERRDFALRSHNLDDVIRGAVELCQPRAMDKGVRIAVEAAPGSVAWVNAPMLESAVVNLVDNAVRHSEPRGKVRVAISETRNELVVTVQDWGEGIAAIHLPRLFERFYRVDPGRDRAEGGSGLGLAIVKHIAQVHGGGVDVESQPGEGSTFSLRLPKGLRQTQ